MWLPTISTSATGKSASDSCSVRHSPVGLNGIFTLLCRAKNCLPYVPVIIHLRSQGKKSSTLFHRHVFLPSLCALAQDVQSNLSTITIRSPACGLTLHIFFSSFYSSLIINSLALIKQIFFTALARAEAIRSSDGFMVRLVNGKPILCKAILHIHQIHFAFCVSKFTFLLSFKGFASHPTPGTNYDLKCLGMIPPIRS